MGVRGGGALGGFLFCNLYLYAYFAVPLRVSDEFRNLTIALNSTFTKECYLRGDPQVYVNWTKDGVLLNKSNTLVIGQVTFEDKGYYECTAENDYGKANSSFWIDVTGKLYLVVYVIYQTCNLTKRLFFKLKPNLNRPIFFSLFIHFLKNIDDQGTKES